MRLFAFGLSALAAIALSAGAASAQHVVRGGEVVSPGYGGYIQPAPAFGSPVNGGSLYTPG